MAIDYSFNLFVCDADQSSLTIFNEKFQYGVLGNVIVGYMDYRASDATLAVGTHGRGVFTTQLTPVVGVGEDPPTGGERIALSQNVPNPARDATTISFSLPRAAEVSLRLYDVTGREVRVLVDGRRESGRHDVPLATKRLPNGVYHYVLRAGTVVETRKLLVRR